jgi:4-carboxymuconolactone decarboxylase
MSYYEEEDLDRFAEVGKHAPHLFEKFLEWYQACQAEGALSRREKALIGLAVAHTVQCPYCIDAYTQSALESGSDPEQMTEAIHMAAAVRGGASLVHGVQCQAVLRRLMM